MVLSSDKWTRQCEEGKVEASKMGLKLFPTTQPQYTPCLHGSLFPKTSCICGALV